MIDASLVSSFDERDLEHMRKQIWSIFDILPQHMVTQNYRVVKTSHIHLNGARIGEDTENPDRSVAALLSVNVILIEPLAGQDMPTDLAAFVCSSFDMAQCSISLSPSESDEFNFRCFGQAAEAIRQERLILQPCAFSARVNTVDVSMRRIWKYLLRGFRLTEDSLLELGR